MSKALDIAGRMASRLAAVSQLAGVPCLVERQKNLAAQIASSIGKASACCIVILYDGFSNSDHSASGRPTVTRRYTVSVFSTPVLAGSTGKLADDVLELAANCLHNWEPVEATDFFSEIHVAGGDFRPDKSFLIYDLDVEVTSKLS